MDPGRIGGGQHISGRRRFAIQEAEARAVVSGDRYDFICTAGPLRGSPPGPQAPDAEQNPEAVYGMRVVALALFAEALAIGIQIYAVFREVGKSERLVTIVVLVVASTQIILTRPRKKGEDEAQPAEAAQTGLSGQQRES